MRERFRSAVAGILVILSVAASAAPAVAAVALTGSYLQIVAHPDDDLLFMNPDMRTGIVAGRPTTTVYLTAGEGVVPTYREPGPAPYSGLRQQGVRAAYALAVDRTNAENDWHREQVRIDHASGSKLVEIDTLPNGRAPITLVFLNLPDGGNSSDEVGGANALTHLRDDPLTVRSTFAPTGSAITTPQRYAQRDLINVLAALMSRFRATVVRTQDPQHAFELRPDHADHIAAAWFAAQAFEAYGSARSRLVSYRDYNISDGQVNLPPEEYAEPGAATYVNKTDMFRTYLRYDREISVDDDVYNQWLKREYRRWWAGTKWVDRNLDGRLQAFAVQNGRLVTWWQKVDDSWAGPLDLGDPGGPLAPGLSVSRNQDGRLEVFALRISDYQTVSTYQTAANGTWLGAFAELGNPNAGTHLERNVGMPAATVDADGRIQIFQKNGGGGVSTRWQTAVNGGFSAWADLGGGPGVQDGLAATTGPGGRIEVFGYAIVGGIGRISHWYQKEPNGVFTINPSLPALEPAGPPTVATNQDGRLDLFYRLATNNSGPWAGQIGHTWQTAPNGGWTSTPESIQGHGGTGPVAVANAPAAGDGSTPIEDARILVLTRNRRGGVSMTRQAAPNGGYEQPWIDRGTYIIDEPAVAADRSGRMVAFAIDGDGHLLVSRQTAASGGAPFTEWEIVEG